MDYFSQLPFELKEYIFKYLPPQDLWNCLSVSTVWRTVSNNDRLWIPICHSRNINEDDFEEEEGSTYSKYALLWRQYFQAIERWRTDHFREHVISKSKGSIEEMPEVANCTVYVFKKKMVLHDYGSKKMFVYNFKHKVYSIEELCSPLVPTAVFFNSCNYIIANRDNTVWIYKKNNQYKLYAGVAFCEDSKLHTCKENIFDFIHSKSNTDFLMPEEVIGDSLWLSARLFGQTPFMNLYVLNLKTFSITDTNFEHRQLKTTTQTVLASNLEEIRIYTFNGDLIRKLVIRGYFKVTDQYIVSYIEQGMPVNVWNMTGHKIHTFPRAPFIVLDPIRHLMYECVHETLRSCRLVAHSLATGISIWNIVLDYNMSEVDTISMIYDRFLYFEIHLREVADEQPSEIAVVLDLDTKSLLYNKITEPSHDSTRIISDHLWVGASGTNLVVHVY